MDCAASGKDPMTKISSDSGARALHNTSRAIPKPVTVDATDLMTNDRVSLGSNDEALLSSTYSAKRSPLSTKAEVDEVGGKTPEEMARSLVLKALRDYGVSTSIELGDGTSKDLTDISPTEAQALISEDGFWGVEQTSDRMFNMMTGLAGGDPARLDEIKAGVAKGFAQASQAFGGSLPDISYRTRDRLLEKLDAWAARGTAPEAPATANSPAQQAALSVLARSV